MATAPETAAQVWLNHLTLGPILAEGRPGRWYAPNAARQVWRWYRSAEPDTLEPFSGWLPVEALAADPGAECNVPVRAQQDDKGADRSGACARVPRALVFSESKAEEDPRSFACLAT